eukprot:gene9837-7351_t
MRGLLLAGAGIAAASTDLRIDFADDASFKLSLGGSTWLESAPIRAFAGHWRNLNRTGATRSTGTDTLGAYSCVNVSWASGALVLHTSLKMYADLAVFVQQLPLGARRTNAYNPVLPGGVKLDAGNYPPVVAFPAFTGGRLQTLGYVVWQSRMINVEWGVNVTSGPPGTNEPLGKGRGLQGLSTNGPVVLFDHGMKSLVVAPMDNFKSAVHTSRGATWETGISSELTDLPPGFEHRTMLVAG